MNSLIRQSNKLDRLKTYILSDITTWPTKQLTFKPSTSSWSALEVIDHLEKVEKEMLEAWKGELPSGHLVGIPDRCRALIVRCVMKSPIKVTVPRGAPIGSA